MNVFYFDSKRRALSLVEVEFTHEPHSPPPSAPTVFGVMPAAPALFGVMLSAACVLAVLRLHSLHQRFSLGRVE